MKINPTSFLAGIFLSLFAFFASAQTITVGTLSPTSICTENTILIPFTVAGGVFDAGNFFTAQLSDATGSFASPVDIGTLISTSNGTIVGTIPAGTPLGTNYRIRIVASSPAAISTNISAALVITIPVGNPTVFGDGEWRAYVYDGNIFSGTATYTGFYTHNSINFNTNDRWGQTGSPSSANATGGNAYQGCTAPLDGHSVSIKRRNFACGYYQINLQHTDFYELLIDGVVVATNTGAATRNNRWRGLLGPNSTIEARWHDTNPPDLNSRFQFALVTLDPNTTLFTGLPIAPICTNNSATINVVSGTTIDFRERPANYTLSWAGPAGFTTNAANTQLVTALGATGNYTFTLTHNTNGCSVSGVVNVPAAPAPTVNITPFNPTVCAGQRVVLTATGSTTYQWRNAVTNALLSSTNTYTFNPTANITINVTGSDGCTNTTTSVTVTVVPNPTDPGTFGNGEWFVACFQGNDANFSLNRYYGFYTETNLNFNSTSRWPQGGSPSQANAATGAPYTSVANCDVSVDNHTVAYRRTNFACGYYRIETVRNDDQGYLFVDGVQVWQRLTNSSTAVTAWEGFLGASSRVEFRWRENTGSSFGQVRVTALGAAAITNPITSPATVTICQGSNTTITTDPFPIQAFFNTDGSFNSNGAAATLTWTQVTGSPGDFTITPSGLNATVQANVTPAINPATIRATFTDPATGCSISRDVLIRVDPLPATAVSANVLTICRGESAILTATGANTYIWSPAAGLSATTGAVVTASPTVTTTYTVGGNNNCATIDASITITVIDPGLNGTEFGNDEWLAHSYNGALVTDPTNAVYRGYYTERSLSFDSRVRWAQNQNPTLAGALANGSAAYVGCSVSNDNHSISFRRTNFPCGFYSISVGRDDRFVLRINGTTVASSTLVGFTPNVWSGLLTDTDQVELIVQEGTGNSYAQLSVAFDVSSATLAIWTGAVSSDWFNPLNWCIDVPDDDVDAIIPGAGVPNMPVINGAGAVTRNILIADGATLTINTGFALGVHGNYELQTGATLLASPNTTVNIVHNALPSSVTISSTGTGAFYNLNINKIGQSATFLSGVTVNNQLTLNNGELNLGNQTLTINNPVNTAIARNNNAYIRSETNAATNNGRICWNIGTSTGNYVYPFGVSATEYIPLTFNKLSAASSNICVATRATAAADNLPWAAGVTNMVGISGGNAENAVIDRWWNITSSLNPLPAPGANVTFSYRGVENTIAIPREDPLAVQHWNGSDWDAPYPNASPGVTTGIGTVTAVGIGNFSPFVLVRVFTPLPVRLLSFSATPLQGAVRLNWETVQAVNDEVHVLERSDDSFRFNALAEIKPENRAEFEYIDRSPLRGAISYYRLRRTDAQGQTEYSAIRAINLSESLAEGMSVVPNPTNGEAILINLQSTALEQVQLSITDAVGNTVYRHALATDTEGRASHQVKVNLAKGMYIAQARTESGKTFQQKVIVR